MTEQMSIEKSLRDWWSKVRAGQTGALPALLGLLVLCIVFGSLSRSEEHTSELQSH